MQDHPLCSFLKSTIDPYTFFENQLVSNKVINIDPQAYGYLFPIQGILVQLQHIRYHIISYFVINIFLTNHFLQQLVIKKTTTTTGGDHLS